MDPSERMDRVRSLLLALGDEFQALVNENEALRENLVESATRGMGDSDAIAGIVDEDFPQHSGSITSGGGAGTTSRGTSANYESRVQNQGGRYQLPPGLDRAASGRHGKRKAKKKLAASSYMLMSAVRDKLEDRDEWTRIANIPVEHTDAVMDITTTGTGSSDTHVATASLDGICRVFTLQGDLLQEYRGHQGAVNSVSFHPHQGLACSASGDATCHVWKVLSLSLEDDEAYMASQSHDLSEDASGNMDIRVEEDIDESERQSEGTGNTPRRREALLQLEGHTGVVSCATWLHHREFIATSSWDRSVRVWDVEASGSVVVTLIGHEAEVHSVSAHPADPLLVSAAHDGTARIFDLRHTSFLVGVCRGHSDVVRSARFDTTGRKVITAGDDRSLLLWDIRNLKAPLQTIYTKSAPNRVSFSVRDGSLAVPFDDGNVRVYNVETGEKTGVLRSRNKAGYCPAMLCCAWLDGRTDMVAGGFAERVSHWQVKRKGSE